MSGWPGRHDQTLILVKEQRTGTPHLLGIMRRSRFPTMARVLALAQGFLVDGIREGQRRHGRARADRVTEQALSPPLAKPFRRSGQASSRGSHRIMSAIWGAAAVSGVPRSAETDPIRTIRTAVRSNCSIPRSCPRAPAILIRGRADAPRWVDDIGEKYEQAFFMPEVDPLTVAALSSLP